ncbi:MAG: hypothetical protein C0465_25420 [Ralstonia sp.]|uniref:glycosyltransferase family 87 protein n=1 Tax=Ralstonia sp. TaxID=54061 RepID=UPI00257B596D|nr:glycosyltransferase family 87 protein [Ralstonia sp.]MBA4007904.1 hypothetical protein [Erythrobacter sp.]MBA4080492.1 hypothetical protein [Erythrobacter sp.]MBA4233916.1 hypothetical protein [Ralstonia sp.]
MRFLTFFELRWLDRSRVRAYAIILTFCSFGSLWWMFQEAMKPGGSDFMAFWSAARMLAQGSGADIYYPDAIRTVQRTVETADVVPFVHPPHFLLWVWPLGFFSYPSAWITWSAVTFGFWMVATRRLFPTMSWPIAGFPGALIAAWHAQTGFLTSGIQALIASQLGNHPFRAGLCIGLLIIKPHVAILMPFALLAARMWSAIAGAAISILISSLASWMCFGSAVWLAYPSSWAVSQHLIEAGDHAFFLRQVTVYAMLRAWDLPEAAAVAQGLATTLSILVIWRFWSIDAPIERKVALLLALTPLATPYLFSYDLPFLVVPVLWLVAHYKQRWSRPALVALYVSPLLCRAVALPLSVNPTPLVCIAMAVLIYRQLGPSGADERFDTS